MAAGFQSPIESSELILRDGHTEDPARQSGSVGRRNYAPDNRKVPPEPFLIDPFRDTDSFTDPDPNSSLAADGFAFGAEQATFVDGAGQVAPGCILVQFTPPKWWGPASHYDVYAADTSDFDADLFIKIGRVAGAAIGRGDSYLVTSHHLQRGRTYDVSLVPCNADGAGMDPADAPRGTVSLTSAGEVPPDVVAFDVSADCCELVGTWTPVASGRKDVSYYEVRQGATFDTGTLVTRVWGWGVGRFSISREAVPFPAFGAPNDEFHIKAVTRLGAVSDAEGSDTLTAIEIAGLTAPCCVKAREITPAVGLDDLVLTSLTPSIVQPIVNPGVGGQGGGVPGPGILFYVDPGSFVPNGALFDYTVRFGMTTLGNETFPLTESTPR